MKCDVWQRIGWLMLNPRATLFPYSRKVAGGRHATRYWLATICALWSAVPAGSAATLVHDFYLPMPEAQIRQTFTALESSVGTTLDSVFSVVVTGEGTVIYYDQWEDGYETDITQPKWN